jgi:serine/threonine-protein kinase
VSLSVSTLDGRVELRELLGRGGMGEVHAAWDRSLLRPVAVKFVHGSGPADAERLLLEARLQARVEHPHVVRVFEVGALQGRPCILLQLVRGSTLGEVASSLSLADRVELCRQAASGLHAAHLQGLVHRDVKPGNILVEEGEDGSRTALVTDFGLAHAEEGGLTRSGLLPGTLDFMAPEQLLGGAPTDFRADVYALGATLYAVLAGRPPFRVPAARPEESGEEQVRVLRRILEEEAPPLRAVAPEVPRELWLVCQKAMEKEPGARYPSAEAFADDLGRIQRGEPVQARAATLPDRAAKWARRNPTASRALAAALVVLAAAGGFTLWLSGQAGREALEAARLGALASSLESRMRMEVLSPPHDLRPALAAVKAEVEALRPQAAQRGGGPASFALGKGLELLDDLDGARLAYQRAWDLGFRTPQAAEGLGTVLGHLYQRAYQRAREVLEPGALGERQSALRAELAEPAQRFLERAASGGWRGPYLGAQIALLEGDLAGARARAAGALAIDPGRYEARVLEGRAWLEEAAVLVDADRTHDAFSRLVEAERSLGSALEWGRSSPETLALLGEVHLRRATLQRLHGAAPDAELGAGLALLARAAALLPGGAAIQARRAEALFERGRALAVQGDRGAVVPLGEANALWRDLARAHPGDRAPLVRLATGLHYEAVVHQDMLGERAADLLVEGLASTAAALALAPRDPAAARARMPLLTRQAALRVALGQGASDLLDEVERLAALASGEAPALAPSVEELLLKALEWRAWDDWRSGRDPRPVLARGRALAEERLRGAQGRVSARTELLSLLEAEVALRAQMGLEAAAQMRLALELLREDLAGAGDVPVALRDGAQTLAVEVERRLLAGEDPSAFIAEARRLLDAAARGGKLVGDVRGVRAWLSWAAARHRAARGLDPGADLDRAEREMGEIPGQPDRLAGNWRTLAACSLERARWAARGRGDPVRAARAGLERVGAALAADGRDPQAWVLRARLLMLAGDPAAARRSLDQAFARQPLVRNSREAREAEEELAGWAR